MSDWVGYLIVLFVGLAASTIGGFVGGLITIDWHERRRVRDLRRKRANIERAIDRDSQ